MTVNVDEQLSLVIEKELLSLKDEKQAKHLMQFFKTGKGQYGEGDKFLGIRVPKTRAVARKYVDRTSFEQLQRMLDNPYHEIRLCALLIMVLQYGKYNDENIINLYIKNVNNINNWDLVDLTAHKIIGAHYIKTHDRTIVDNLAQSKHLWSERIAVVSQWSVIKTGEFELLLELCEKFSTHKHDLMHKATGWMLREIGKKDEKVLLKFLDKHAKNMPRTMLRYSIEKLTHEQRKFYMQR